jgi:hypothetical protein
LEESSYWNGITSSLGQFTTVKEDSIFKFENHFTRSDWGFGLAKTWSGFAYSRMQDDSTTGFTNQYSAITASGANGSENYAVYYIQGRDTVWLKQAAKLDSVFITNGTYPYHSMKEGDKFTKKFGGESGDEEDWFLLTIRGLKDGIPTDTIEFYLADYRFADNEQDYIINEWTKIDLSLLDTVDMLEFSLSSSDTGDWGMNTPAYFCMDDLGGAGFEEFSYISGDYWNGEPASFGSYASTFSDGIMTFPNVYSITDFGFGAFEAWTGWAYSNMQDSVTAGFTNQYSAFPAGGAKGSSNYGLCYNSQGADTIKLETASQLTGTYVTNGTYNVLSMRNGGMFEKKFGGESGNDPDWFLLTIKGINSGDYTNTVEFYLADYRFEDNEQDYIVTDWEWIDLSSLGVVEMVEFSLSSSDTGDFGMNTPAYFFVDNFNDEITSVENLTAGIKVQVYPNPFVSNIHVVNQHQTRSVNVMDMTGKIVKKIMVDGNRNIIELNLQDLDAGIYLLQVNSSKGTSVTRVVKQ